MVEDKILKKQCRISEVREVMEITNNIEQFESFMVKAGAGSGKTHSLVQSITNILDKQNEKLTENNQIILCITYTNAAADEIKERIGNSSIVKVSTIHDFLWSIIKNYQPELIEEHVLKIKKIISKNDDALLDSKYKDLSDIKKTRLKQIIFENRDCYNRIKNTKAAQFREALPKDFKVEFKNLLTNINNFKDISNKLLSNYTLERTLIKIQCKSEEYSRVIYDTNKNYDQLSRMKISHDTLLEYSRNLVEKYELLRIIIRDKYPYIFVDEYQDTSPVVIELLNSLEKDKENRKFIVGFFGDEAQSIYDKSIGNQLLEVFSELKIVRKDYNFRSSDSVIKLANLTRLDSLKQDTAFINNTAGETNFVVQMIDKMEQKTAINKVIDKYQEKWKINSDNKLCVFLTLNKYLSEINGFDIVYDFFSNSPYYKTFWEQLNQETLSRDANKLGVVPKKLYDILKFKFILNNNQTNISELIPKKVLKTISYLELESIINELLILRETNTISEFINQIIFLLKKMSKSEEIESWKEILQDYITYDDGVKLSYLNFIGSLIEPLKFADTPEGTSDVMIAQLSEILEGPIYPFEKWFKFLNMDDKEEISFSTIHATKGNEFDNVIVVLEEDFGARNRGYFKKAISNVIDNNNHDSVKDAKEILATNLLYVACTRAKKNITFLYFGEINDQERDILTNNVDNYYDDIDEIKI